MASSVYEPARIGIGTLVNVLQLEAAFFVIPILEPGYHLVLVKAQSSIVVEEIVGSDQVEPTPERHAACKIGTAANGVTVFSLQVFGPQIAF